MTHCFCLRWSTIYPNMLANNVKVLLVVAAAAYLGTGDAVGRGEGVDAG